MRPFPCNPRLPLLRKANSTTNAVSADPALDQEWGLDDDTESDNLADDFEVKMEEVPFRGSESDRPKTLRLDFS